METKTVSAKMQRQRRFLLFVPLVVLPFIIMLFWALGGGQQAAARQTQGNGLHGLDVQLPDAASDSKSSDKMSSYQQADKDSARLADLLRNDPYRPDTASLGNAADPSTAYAANGLTGVGTPDDQALNERMASLYKQISDAQHTDGAVGAPANAGGYRQGNLVSGGGLGSSAQTDPDMQQLSGMLDKILYIEHPEMAQEKIKAQSLKNRKQAFLVTTLPEDNAVQLMEPEPTAGTHRSRGHNAKHGFTNDAGKDGNAFYEYSDLSCSAVVDGNAIRAVVAQTRSLVTGATIKLRLLSDIFIDGKLVPKGECIYGTCSISGDRLLVTLSSIHSGNSIFPVSLALYDIDGIAGIYMPDAISRKVSKSSADQAIQGIDLYAFDNSLKGQAASAGVQAVKGLFSKKAELIKVTVREGYQVLLKNTNENNY